jgi:hypothetical protein
MQIQGALLVRISDYSGGKRLASVWMQGGAHDEPVLLARDIDIVIGSVLKIVPVAISGSIPPCVSDGGPAPKLPEADVPSPGTEAPGAKEPPPPPPPPVNRRSRGA